MVTANVSILSYFKGSWGVVLTTKDGIVFSSEVVMQFRIVQDDAQMRAFHAQFGSYPQKGDNLYSFKRSDALYSIVDQAFKKEGAKMDATIVFTPRGRAELVRRVRMVIQGRMSALPEMAAVRIDYVDFLNDPVPPPYMVAALKDETQKAVNLQHRKVMNGLDIEEVQTDGALDLAKAKAKAAARAAHGKGYTSEVRAERQDNDRHEENMGLIENDRIRAED